MGQLPGGRGGVFAVARSIFDDPDFAPEPFTQREAFMWMVASAAYAEMKVRGTKGTVTLQRGELCFSIRFLAEKWQWSKSRVERFLSALKNRDIIRDTQRDSNQIWIINKYNDFQILPKPKRDSDRDTQRDSSGTAAGQQRDKEEDSKDSKDRNTSSLRSEVGAETPRSELAKVLDDDHSKAVVEHRRKMRKPLTAHAAKLLAGKFSKWPDPNEAADIMISNGWQGFEPEWVAGRSRGSIREPPKSAFQEHQDRATATLERALKRGNGHDERFDFDDGQPAFDLAPGDFRTVRKAGSGQ